MAIVLKSWTIESNRSDGLYISGLTTITAEAVVEATPAIDQASFVIMDSDGNRTTVTPTLQSGKWSWTGQTTAVGDFNISLIFTNAGGDRLTGYAKPYTVMEHTAPSLSVQVYRCDSEGDRIEEGGYLSVTVWAESVPSLLGLDGGAEVDGDISEGYIPIGQRTIIGDGLIEPDTKYRLSFRVQDMAGTVAELRVVVPPVTRILNVKDGGTGIAFGKKATQDNMIGKPDTWVWEGVNDNFDSTGYVTATGTSGAITVKEWTISEAGVYLATGTGYMTRTGYTAANQALMSDALTVYRYNSAGTSQESYSQRAHLTGGGDCCVSALMNCNAGDTITFKMQQTAGSSGVTLASQTFYVRSAIIRLV